MTAAAEAVHDELLVVFGVVDASIDSSLLPDDVELVTEGSVAAVVAATGTSSVGPAAQLRRHDAVVRKLVADGVTILPMRFGTAVADSSGLVSDVLAPHADRFAAALTRLDGLVQYTVRVGYVEDAVVAAVLRDDPRAAQLRDAVRRHDGRQDLRISLGQAVSEAIDRRRPRDVARIGAMIEPLATEVVVHAGERSDRLAEYACLVPRGESEVFEQQLEQLAARHHEAVHMTLLGPLAPYDFVPAF